MMTEGQGRLPDVSIPNDWPSEATTGSTSPRDIDYQDERPDAEVIIPGRGPGATAVAGAEASESGHQRSHSFRNAWKQLLPELAALMCSAVCVFISMLIDNSIARLICGCTGAMLLFYSMMSAPSKISYLMKTPGPPKIQTCVWALCSFGDLCEGRQVELREHCCQETSAKEDSGRVAQSSSRSGLSFLHPPRLENGACFVCMEDFAVSTNVAALRCGHVFCEPCMRSWAAACSAAEVACPICRMSLRAE